MKKSELRNMIKEELLKEMKLSWKGEMIQDLKVGGNMPGPFSSQPVKLIKKGTSVVVDVQYGSLGTSYHFYSGNRKENFGTKWDIYLNKYVGNRIRIREDTRGESDVLVKFFKKEGTYIVYILSDEAKSVFSKWKTQLLTYHNKKVPVTGGTLKTYKKMLDFLRKNNLSIDNVTLG